MPLAAATVPLLKDEGYWAPGIFLWYMVHLLKVVAGFTSCFRGLVTVLHTLLPPALAAPLG